MNIFQLLGDLSHVLAIIILLFKIWKTRSCAGISGKSQILFATVYTMRYLDLLTVYISAYNRYLKIFFIVISYTTVFLIYMKFKATYDHNHDTFRIEFLLLPTLVLALVANYEFSVIEVLWAFSIYLESVAILPQLFFVLKTREVESITSYYLFALASYRGLYLLSWVYRYYMEDQYGVISIVAGLVQTVIYFDFFVQKSVWLGSYNKFSSNITTDNGSGSESTKESVKNVEPAYDTEKVTKLLEQSATYTYTGDTDLATTPYPKDITIPTETNRQQIDPTTTSVLLFSDQGTIKVGMINEIHTLPKSFSK